MHTDAAAYTEEEEEWSDEFDDDADEAAPGTIITTSMNSVFMSMNMIKNSLTTSNISWKSGGMYIYSTVVLKYKLEVPEIEDTQVFLLLHYICLIALVTSYLVNKDFLSWNKMCVQDMMFGLNELSTDETFRQKWSKSDA